MEVCINEKSNKSVLDQPINNFKLIAKMNMMVAVVVACNDLSVLQDGVVLGGAMALKNEYVNYIKSFLDILLETIVREQLSRVIFYSARQRLLDACFAQGADSLGDELINNDAYWLKADPVANEQDKVFAAALSIIAANNLELVKKYLAKTSLEQDFYAQLLKGAILHNKENIFDYILRQFGSRISLQKLLEVVDEACNYYDENSYYFCCFLDCDWLNKKLVEKRVAQLKITAYAVTAFKAELPELLEALKNFTAEDMQLLKSIDSRFYDSFCEEFKNKYPHLFVKLISSFACRKVKVFMAELKDFITLVDGGQQEIVFCFNDSNVYAQFMEEWHRKHGNNYSPSVELRPVKPNKNLEVIISKTVKLSLDQVSEFCEKIRELTERVASKLKLIAKKKNRLCEKKT